MRTLLLAVLLVGTGCNSAPLGPPPDADLNILFVGNSLTYTNNLPGMLEFMLETHGDVGEVHVESVAFPNYGLVDHWAEGSARARLAAGSWDYVIIQQGPSATEGRPSLLEYSAFFADEAASAGARLALYMVWPARTRAFDFDGVADSYATAAEENGALLFPVGEAWREAWAIRPTLELYGPDGFHPSILGTHLAALVMYEQLSGKDPRTYPASIPTGSGPIELPIELGDVLHDAAVAANSAHALP